MTLAGQSFEPHYIEFPVEQVIISVFESQKIARKRRLCKNL